RARRPAGEGIAKLQLLFGAQRSWIEPQQLRRPEAALASDQVGAEREELRSRPRRGSTAAEGSRGNEHEREPSGHSGDGSRDEHALSRVSTRAQPFRKL